MFFRDLFLRYTNKYRLPLPINPTHVARSLNVRVECISSKLIKCYLNKELGLRYKDLCGLAHIKDGVKFILYNKSLNPNRIRYTIAHELGHHVLGHTDGFVCYDGNFSACYVDEIDANFYANELLVPISYLKIIRTYGEFPPIGTLAKLFKVSENLMEKRIRYYYECAKLKIV